MKSIHIPVLLDFICEHLLKPTDKYIIDATLGEGGHSREFLKRSLNVIAFERDKKILSVAKDNLESYQERIAFCNLNYSDMLQVTHQHKAMKNKQIDLALFDLGISRFHYEEHGRGFSFQRADRLDMRLEPHIQPVDAAKVINTYPLEKLADIFWHYGEQKLAYKIARHIIFQREKEPFYNSDQLAKSIADAFSKNKHKKKIHPSTQIFQALRIYVNSELEHIEAGLDGALACLRIGGRLAVMTYHSLEDRLVKKFFNQHVTKASNFNKFREKTPLADYKLWQKKPIIPTSEEIINNRSARSAKLRVLIKNK